MPLDALGDEPGSLPAASVPLPVPDGWRLPALGFVLCDSQGALVNQGRAPRELLPPARRTVAVVAAADTLLLPAKVPPLPASRLRLALPNLVEDALLQDPQRCHFALWRGLRADRDDVHPDVVAVIDRAWFAFLVDSFAARGAVRFVAQALTLPGYGTAALAEPMLAPSTAPVSAAARSEPQLATPARRESGEPGEPVSLPSGVPASPAQLFVAEDGLSGLELIVRHEPALAEGLHVAPQDFAATAGALGVDPSEAIWLDTPDAPIANALAARMLSSAQQAAGALACPHDLRQFEFVGDGRGPAALARRMRWAIGFLAAALLVATVGVNLDWWRLRRENQRLDERMTQTLLDAFPKLTVVLDPPQQMSRELATLRTAVGELSPDDFLPLADGLARSLGAIPATAIASMTYRDRALEVVFRPGSQIDAGFGERLARNGLRGTGAGQRWNVRQATPGAAQ